MSGLLHHLDDKTADKFIKKAGKVLKVGGHLIIIDNCLHSRQSNIKQRIILQDRGKFVRGINELNSLVLREDFEVSMHIEENLLLIPYTHIIFVCKRLNVGN